MISTTLFKQELKRAVMAHDVMLMIGKFPFMSTTAGYDSLSKQTSWRWAKTELIGNTPNYQFIGEGDQTITISGAVYPYQHGFSSSIERLKNMASSGDAQLMVNMKGNSLGYWIIQSISESESVHFSDGTPRKIAFDISLAYAGEYSLKGTNSNLNDGVATISSRVGDL